MSLKLPTIFSQRIYFLSHYFSILICAYNSLSARGFNLLFLPLLETL